MLEIRRVNVEQGSICRVWATPVPNDEGEFVNYRVWGNRIDAEENVHWDNADITGATEEDPIDFELIGSSGFYSLVDVVFGSANGAGVAIYNQIFTLGDEGQWYQHGMTEYRMLIPAVDNALKWTTISVSMKAPIVGGVA